MRKLHLRWHIITFVAGSLLGFLLWGRATPFGNSPSRVLAEQPNGEPDLAALRADVELLKGKATDQSHVMSDVDYHFTNLWFAGKAKNWPLADFYWKETLSHIKWAVRVIPVRKDNAGREVKLESILQAIENSPQLKIGDTIQQKDSAKFETTYRAMIEQGCYTCHKAADKPYLRPRIPERPGSEMINFDPNATWPK